jgi:hypothetical protein
LPSYADYNDAPTHSKAKRSRFSTEIPLPPSLGEQKQLIPPLIVPNVPPQQIVRGIKPVDLVWILIKICIF